MKNELTGSIFLIFLVTLITHGSRIAGLGYYYDDWYMLWSGAARGASSMLSLFSTDRPYMGVVYSYSYRLLGDTIINWHLYALLWRFLGAMAFFWILCLLWPRQKLVSTLLTVLFVVYPAFLSQPDANTKSNHLIGFASALFSIALMLQAMKARTRLWSLVCIGLSLLFTANYLLIYEYMIGFEGTRVLLLGYAMFHSGIQDWRSLIKSVMIRWWPYIVVTAGFLYWRIFIFTSNRNATDAGRLADDYFANIRHMSVRLVFETAMDFIDTTLFAWFVKPYHLLAGAEYSELGLAALMVMGVLVCVWLYFKWMGKNAAEEEDVARDFLWLGALITLFATFPVVLSGRNVELMDAYKSYGLHPISGVVLFVGGILLKFRPDFRRAALMVLLAFSVMAQGLNISSWERFWVYERDTWWQLSWRAPDIQDDTLVILYFPDSYRLQQDYEVWGPVNLIYRPGPAEVPVIQAEVLTVDTSYDIIRGRVRESQVRDLRLHRDFNNLLLLTKPTANSCLHALDGSLPVFSENEAYLVRQVAAYSRIDRIIPDGEAPTPPVNIFRAEPAHGWCYYYEKASLARQTGDWAGIGKIYKQVRAQKLQPGDQSEWFVFFEGLVNLGRLDDAQKIYQQEFKGRERFRYPLCDTLARDPGYPASFGYDYPTIYSMMCKQ
jgi:hypothetical protein